MKLPSFPELVQFQLSIVAGELFFFVALKKKLPSLLDTVTSSHANFHLLKLPHPFVFQGEDFGRCGAETELYLESGRTRCSRDGKTVRFIKSMNSQTSKAPTQTAMQAQVDDTTDITDIYIYIYIYNIYIMIICVFVSLQILDYELINSVRKYPICYVLSIMIIIYNPITVWIIIMIIINLHVNCILWIIIDPL